MANEVRLMPPLETALAAPDTPLSFRGKVTLTANMSSPGYSSYLIGVRDRSGGWHPNLEVTAAQFASAQFAQQNGFPVNITATAAGPGTVIDLLVYA